MNIERERRERGGNGNRWIGSDRERQEREGAGEGFLKR